ncbi:zinc metallopeptidase [Clostridium sp. MSJ-8]|uniref:zinc metallopeptidase n=1 Tax=Clostridium sp. MSJ-8 TaxID=2841510 RepID=UPI001C0EA327|nr:zinc metallopeptidase [Clostridium sp. MSJ-8]MBU5488621.1 zinc metallopeptidase [Clostridium sp. MSJ-8]
MPYYGFYDWTILILLPAMILSLIAQLSVSGAFNKYRKVYNRNGYTGEQVARMLLDDAGLYDIPIEVVNKKLGDHYDPSRRILRLSREVYYEKTIAAAGVAAHEVGHAIQHSKGYVPLTIRSAIVPAVNISSSLSWIIFVAGLILSIQPLVNVGIILFVAVVIFQIVTLPVEFNASGRALKILGNKGILYDDELKGTKKVLGAAALTYVAAAITSILQLLRLIAISKRND